ncbi:MAG: Lrp/AsnC family transcriptional regulator [Parvibaculales bacterium]
MPQFDELDKDIMNLLAEDARLSNRNLASQLNCTEGTIRARIKRLERDNLMRITAVTNLEHLDKPLLGYIDIKTEPSQIRSVAEKLAAMDIIGAVIIQMGHFDILAIGLFETLEQFHNVASMDILSLPDVNEIETSVVVNFVKYDKRIAKILPADHQ